MRKGIMLKGALLSGKICTTVLFVSLIALVLFPTISITVVKIIAIVDSIFLSIAFIDYLIAYIARSSQFQSVTESQNTDKKNRS